jgi:hypothetical protein
MHTYKIKLTVPEGTVDLAWREIARGRFAFHTANGCLLGFAKGDIYKLASMANSVLQNLNPLQRGLLFVKPSVRVQTAKDRSPEEILADKVIRTHLPHLCR